MVKPAGLLSNRYEVKDMPDLTGKVAIVVGGSRGIGEAAVHALVQKNCRVHIISATEAHAEAAIDHASELTPKASELIETHQVDLGDLPAVQALCEKIASSFERLDMLMLIAGIGVAPFGMTKSGLGNHFGINNVAFLQIADILYPLLKKTAEMPNTLEGSVRIVCEASELHRSAPSDVKAESLEEMATDLGGARLYGRSKLGVIWFAQHLASVLPAYPPVLAISVHPGAVSTEQQSGATESYPILGKALEYIAPAVFMTKEQGSESALWAATAPGLGEPEKRAQVNGQYFTEADGKPGTESSQAQDPGMAARFWALCVKALKEKGNYEVKLGTAAY
ncbi:uncharacterized protein MKK02DRAFT_45374 [Dioszegia hungarica]|uniref:NAD(P)-binding protein n=1 Tax=Dioszegia hungarica TaxID=4972 RepID=A0AA38HCV7_9TREE|nr:uncharacterized protein MKK02DRAFT_45374 [Dioszegia hungarica]KAI9636669.1 hypothetical protein MKK02DRAFT_45374 [Dioszegia hungarica]